MTEKDLIEKLNTLKSIAPDPAWKTQSRNILVRQINSGETNQTNDRFGFIFVIEDVLRRVASPMAVSAFVLMFLVASGFLGINFAQDSRPGDSFYIAKIVSEKAQLALTFDENKKVRLGLNFAAKRAAELDEVMNEEADDESRVQKIAKLKDDIRRELSVAKERLETINSRQIKPESTEATTQTDVEEGEAMFTANLEKENGGLETSEVTIEGDEPGSLPEAVEGSEDTVEVRVTIEKESTTTAETNATGTAETIVKETSNTKELLEEADELIKQEDYSGAIDKLNKVDESIDDAYEGSETEGSESDDSGQVLGVEESSTTTEISN